MAYPTPRVALYGNPPSETYEPRKSDLQAVLEQIETLAIGPIKNFTNDKDSLPTSGNDVGDLWIVLDAGSEGGVYRWYGSGWSKRGPIPLVLTESVSAQQAQSARDEARDARDDAKSYRDTAKTYRDQALTYRDAAQVARTGAETARTGAEAARNLAQSYRDTAKIHRDDALTARSASQAAQAQSEAAADQAELAATVAVSNVDEIYESIAAGIAGVADGDMFAVFDDPSGTALGIYRRSGAGSVRLGTLGEITFSTAVDLIDSTMALETGAYVRTRDGYRYLVLSSSASPYDLATAGGERLRVLSTGPVSCRAFGARGDGVSDDTARMQLFMNWIKRGGSGYLAEGRYLCDTLSCVSGTAGFRLTGAGIGRAVILHRSDALGTQGVYISNTPDVAVSGFTVDNQETPAEEGEVEGRGIGLSIKNCPRTLVDQVEALNTGSVGIFCYGNQDSDGDFGADSTLTPEQHITRCRTTNCSRGIQLVGVRESKITLSHAENSKMSGIYLKCPIVDSMIADCTSDGATWPFAIGSSYGTTRRATRIRFSNLIGINGKTGLKAYCLDDSVLDGVSLHMTGDNTDGVGDGLRLEYSNRVRVEGLRVQGVGELRAAIRLLESHNCYVELGAARTFGANANHAGTSGTGASNNNTVVVSGPIDTVSNPSNWNAASSGNRYIRTEDERDRDRMYFGRDLYGHGHTINADVGYAFGFPEGQAYNYLGLMAGEAGSKVGVLFGDHNSNTQSIFRYSISDSIFQFMIGSTEKIRFGNDLLLFANAAEDAATTIRVGTASQSSGGQITYNPHLSPKQWRVRADNADVLRIAGSYLTPNTDNVAALGQGGLRWSQLYAGTATINTSDEREKTDIGAIDDAILDAWSAVQWRSFRFSDAVAEKGSAARTHVGVIAQQIEAVFVAAELDAFALGILCHDTWTDEETGETRDRYGVRYEEALALESALLRRTQERLEARLAALEAAAG